MTEIEKAYLAGIIDGEGTITLSPEGEFRYPCLSFCNNDKSIVDYINNFCYGTVRLKKSKNEKWHDNYIWCIKGRRAIEVIELIIPYMHEQKKIRRGISIINNYLKLTPRNGRYSVELKELKKRWEEEFFLL